MHLVLQMKFKNAHNNYNSVAKVIIYQKILQNELDGRRKL